MQSDFFKYAYSLSEQLLYQGDCYVKVDTGDRKFRHIYLSNVYLYVMSEQKVKYKLTTLKIKKLVSSAYSGQMAIITDHLKAVLIDGLIARQKIKKHLLEAQSDLEHTTVRRANLQEFVERNTVPEDVDKRGEAINLLEMRDTYEEYNIIQKDRSFIECYHAEHLLSRDQYSTLLTAVDISGLGEKVLKKPRKRTKQVKNYTIRIYKKKQLNQNEIMLDRILRERTCLEMLLSPYTPVLWKAYHSPSAVYCITEHYRAQPLTVYLKEQFLSKSSFRNLIAQIVIALGQFHECNYVYNAVDIDHIYITDDGYVMLNCFQDCCEVGTDLSKSQYEHLVRNRPPEEKHNKVVNIGWDWWGLGCMIEQIREVKKKQEGEINGWFKKECLAELLRGLSQPDPRDRLGWRNDYHQILKNDFFSKISKKDLADRKGQPVKATNIELPKTEYQSEGEDHSANDRYLEDYEFTRELQDL